MADRCKRTVNDETSCKNVWCKLPYTQAQKNYCERKTLQKGEAVQQTAKWGSNTRMMWGPKYANTKKQNNNKCIRKMLQTRNAAITKSSKNLQSTKRIQNKWSNHKKCYSYTEKIMQLLKTAANSNIMEVLQTARERWAKNKPYWTKPTIQTG